MHLVEHMRKKTSSSKWLILSKLFSIICPSCGLSSPDRTLIKVDFPDPLGPRIPIKSFFLI